ncbi:MAG: formylmethanofuran--tetrahydromethanopterin N-formyltransferase [Candidatus Altiarchaeales archaeon ex4484_2]|nr:MAG: formylmethanofuran--tetrahydromethanopterin N-formyltransferase [Candidatus Altiarchaeales archaeon ex4484_2]
MPALIEDTYAEAFRGLYSRILVTARNRKWLDHAVNCATGYASSTIGCGCEAGVDVYVNEKNTPDRRPGALLQFWTPCWDKNAVKVLEGELMGRIGQCILTAPTTRVFNATTSRKKLAVGRKLGFYGDGFQKEEKRYGREMIVIPTMSGSFLVEKELGYTEGVMGGNLWFMASSRDSALDAVEKAVEAISDVGGVVTPFPGGVCASGSKTGSKYSFLKASTHERYCSTLKGEIKESNVPVGVESITEVVINGVSEGKVRQAMLVGIKASLGVNGLVKISAGNYGGRLGRYKIHLRD